MTHILYLIITVKKSPEIQGWKRSLKSSTQMQKHHDFYNQKLSKMHLKGKNDRPTSSVSIKLQTQPHKFTIKLRQIYPNKLFK